MADTWMLMGGGGSFSARGPGKGMYSQLYLRMLNEYPDIHSFSAFNSIYNNTTIFGIQATTSSEFAPKAIDVAAKELIVVATNGESTGGSCQTVNQVCYFNDLESRKI